jgi:hypothetical protein
MKAVNNKKKGIDNLVKSYFDDEIKLLKKYNLSKRLVVIFPKNNRLQPKPFDKLLLKILSRRGLVLDTEFSIKK